MSIEEIIRREQNRYVSFFSGAKTALQKENRDIQTEVLITLKKEEAPYPYRYMRPDAVSTNGEGKMAFSMLHQGADPEFVTSSYDCSTFRLDIHPFAWSDVQLIFDKPLTDLRKIEDWITRWLDVNDSGAHEHAGLSGAVHGFYPVEQQGPLWILMGDMGTAPAEALIELLLLLGKQGMSHIVLAGD